MDTKHIHIEPQPVHTTEEKALLRSEDEAAVLMAKSAANACRLNESPTPAWRIFTDGSVSAKDRAQGQQQCCTLQERECHRGTRPRQPAPT